MTHPSGNHPWACQQWDHLYPHRLSQGNSLASTTGLQGAAPDVGSTPAQASTAHTSTLPLPGPWTGRLLRFWRKRTRTNDCPCSGDPRPLLWGLTAPTLCSPRWWDQRGRQHWASRQPPPQVEGPPRQALPLSPQRSPPPCWSLCLQHPWASPCPVTPAVGGDAMSPVRKGSPRQEFSHIQHPESAALREAFSQLEALS